MKRILVMHPFLLALWTVLFAYSENLGFLSFSQAWMSLFLLLSLTSVLLLLFSAILRSVMKAGAVLSLFLILFFSYAHVYSMLWREGTTYAPTDESLGLMIAWATLFAGGTALIFRIKVGWPEYTKILNVLALTLIAIPVFKIGVHGFRTRISQQDVEVKPIEIAQTGTIAMDTLPNIYYIILDAYGRADILQEVYDYDNSEFLDYLSQMGFFVASKSQANYAQRDLSLASSLNLMYLDDVAAAVGAKSSDRLPLAYMIQNNAVAQFLKQRGYTIVALASGYSATDLRSSDIHVGSGRTWNELEARLLCSTPIPWLAIRGSVFDPYAMHREKVLYTLNHIAGAAELPSPHFVFAHVLAPHGPFVFDEQGNEIQPESQFDLRGSAQYHAAGWTWEDHSADYTGQVRFINNTSLFSRTCSPSHLDRQS
jgi:hypothetical protein